jgi:hypothetical protein
MTSTLRDQAAAAARAYYQTNPEGPPTDMDTATAMYLLGHATGVEDGARGFAEYADENEACVLIDQDYTESATEYAARYLAALASGTVAEEKGEEE